MEQKLAVKVAYRNERLETIYEKDYTLNDYCAMLREDQLRLITDVEDMVYELTDNKSKADWPDETWSAFCKIKHKILDKAGDIGRQPENIDLSACDMSDESDESDSLTSFVAKVFKGVR